MTTPNLRILTYPVPGNHSTSYKAEVKGPGVREYIGCFDNEREAREAAEDYLRTGRKPPRAKRGPKGPHVNERRQQAYRPRAPREFKNWGPKPTPSPAANQERLALIRQIAGRLA